MSRPEPWGFDRQRLVATIVIELLLVLATILVLCLLGYSTETVSLGEAAVWGGGGLILVLAALWVLRARWGTVSGRRRTGPGAAEGLALLRRGEMDAAERLLSACLERRPGDAEVLRGLADIAWRRGDNERFVQLAARVLAASAGLRRAERVALCHRQADVCLARLNDPQRAVEALARVELDYPGTTDAVRARRRIERILARGPGEFSETV